MAPTSDFRYSFETERHTPLAAITYDKSGRPVYELASVPARRQLGYQFDQEKAIANIAAEDKMIRPRSGLRTAARETLQMEWARREDSKYQPRPARNEMDFYLRTSSDNPLAEKTARAASAKSANEGGAQRQGLRTYGEVELPNTLRTHVMPYMAPMAADIQRVQQKLQDHAIRNQALLDKVAAAKEFGRRACQEYPHGLTRLEIAKLRQSNNGLVHLADLPGLSLEYRSTSSPQE